MLFTRTDDDNKVEIKSKKKVITLYYPEPNSEVVHSNTYLVRTGSVLSSS